MTPGVTSLISEIELIKYEIFLSDFIGHPYPHLWPRSFGRLYTQPNYNCILFLCELCGLHLKLLKVLLNCSDTLLKCVLILPIS